MVVRVVGAREGGKPKTPLLGYMDMDLFWKHTMTKTYKKISRNRRGLLDPTNQTIYYSIINRTKEREVAVTRHIIWIVSQMARQELLHCFHWDALRKFWRCHCYKDDPVPHAPVDIDHQTIQISHTTESYYSLCDTSDMCLNDGQFMKLDLTDFYMHFATMD